MPGPTDRDDVVRHTLNDVFAPDPGAICTATVGILARPDAADPDEEAAILQAQAVHGLIRNDAAIPARLRSMLVAYAGLLLDKARPIILTPKAIAALERRPR